MNDEVFKVYARNFEVRNSNNEIEEIYIDDSHPLWIKKEFKLMLDMEMKKWISLFLNLKTHFNSLDSVIFHPGANYYTTPPDIDEVNPGEFGLDFLIKSGKTLYGQHGKDH